ncbi:MAG: hypothetical protein HYY93_14795 [Planctomycetes bacterium]|nr:hypothetical protein [Planctomycetota bacterium]
MRPDPASPRSRRGVPMALALLAIAALGRVFVYSDDPNPMEDPNMPATKHAPARAGIPPIDAEAPAVTETATFALG